MFSFGWLKKDWQPSECCLHSKFFYLSTVLRITSSLGVNFQSDVLHDFAGNFQGDVLLCTICAIQET